MSKSSNPLIAILLFLLIALVLSFYDSEKVVMWATQGETQRENIFLSLSLSYAQKAEKIKQVFGMADFFEKESSFWKKLKNSPVISQPTFVMEPKETAIVKIPIEKAPEKKEEKTISLPEVHSPYRFLIIGDSFIAVWGGVGEILEKEILNYKDVSVKRFGQVSSGLSRPDYFNWETKTIELISQYNPNVSVIMLSSNDAQSIITPNGALVANYGEANWNSEYSKRVSSMLDIFEENDIAVFWLGFPIMKNKTFSDRIKNLNSIYEKGCQKKEKAFFLSSWEALTDENGNYTAYLPDKQGIYRLVRQTDGIHPTYFGGEFIADEFIKNIKEIIELEPRVESEP